MSAGVGSLAGVHVDGGRPCAMCRAPDGRTRREVRHMVVRRVQNLCFGVGRDEGHDAGRNRDKRRRSCQSRPHTVPDQRKNDADRSRIGRPTGPENRGFLDVVQTSDPSLRLNASKACADCLRRDANRITRITEIQERRQPGVARLARRVTIGISTLLTSRAC